jgi:DNA-binding PadR family transcriptional regulator
MTEPDALLPLKTLVFRILVSLASEEKHGYALMKDLAEGALPGPKLFPASLYRTLRGMRDDRLIADVTPGTDKAEGPQRRRFGVTAFGRQVATAEMNRMASLIAAAQDADLVAERSSK